MTFDAWVILGCATVALGLSSTVVRLVLRWSRQAQVLDTPNARSLHSMPVPRGGGWGIVGPVMAVLVVGSLTPAGGRERGLLGILVGAAAVAGVSWRDDLRSVSPGLRLLVHTLAAALAVLTLGYWHTITWPWGGQLVLGSAGTLVTMLWIVGLTNAYNFMDGIDGLAAGQAILAGTGWAYVGWLSGDPVTPLLGAVLAGSSAGFLQLNWPPARLFMGDVGSAFVGFVFAVLPLVAAKMSANGLGGAAPLVGVLLVWPFLFDSGLTLVRRALAGENPLRAHRSHLYQRLVQSGRSHRFTTLLYLALSGTGLLSAVLWMGGRLAAPVLALIPLLAAALYGFVARAERRTGRSPLAVPDAN